jgi:hypothetical protein
VRERGVVGAREGPERAQQGRVGELALALFHPLAAEHERGVGVLLGDPPGELGDQAGLANARLAAEEDDRGPAIAGVTQRVL